MDTSIFIPKRLNVGFQNRRDTYTGKLAYVVYYDEKNKLRKDKSWNSWRDQSIPNEEFDNEPTSGFVLNKNVGDYDTGWNHRKAYCRVYDPRNFEFEITIENLLYILANTSCIKGKGLEGDFVYGWLGTELILIPTCSPDYKKIMEYTDRISTGNTVKVKDLVLGATYESKEGYHYIYMGKHSYYDEAYKYVDNGEEKIVDKYSKLPYDRGRYNVVDYTSVIINKGEKHWFAVQYDKNAEEFTGDFETYSGVPKKLLKCVSKTQSAFYEGALDRLQQHYKFSPPDPTKNELIPYTWKQFNSMIMSRHWYGNHDYIYSDTCCQYKVIKNKDSSFRLDVVTSKNNDLLRVYHCGCAIIGEEAADDIRSRFGDRVKYNRDRWHAVDEYYVENITLQEIFESLKPCYVECHLENGRRYRTIGYYLH